MHLSLRGVFCFQIVLAKTTVVIYPFRSSRGLNLGYKLRKQGILSEVLFWEAFKDKEKIKGYDIDRQVIIGNFIVDFFIAELGLVVEIDGNSQG